MSNLYDGRENNKNITSDDEFTYAIMNGMFNKVKYKLFDDDGVLRVVEGGYIIVDGGYQIKEARRKNSADIRLYRAL